MFTLKKRVRRLCCGVSCCFGVCVEKRKRFAWRRILPTLANNTLISALFHGSGMGNFLHLSAWLLAALCILFVVPHTSASTSMPPRPRSSRPNTGRSSSRRRNQSSSRSGRPSSTQYSSSTSAFPTFPSQNIQSGFTGQDARSPSNLRVDTKRTAQPSYLAMPSYTPLESERTVQPNYLATSPNTLLDPIPQSPVSIPSSISRPSSDAHQGFSPAEESKPSTLPLVVGATVTPEFSEPADVAIAEDLAEVDSPDEPDIPSPKAKEEPALPYARKTSIEVETRPGEANPMTFAELTSALSTDLDDIDGQNSWFSSSTRQEISTVLAWPPKQSSDQIVATCLMCVCTKRIGGACCSKWGSFCEGIAMNECRNECVKERYHPLSVLDMTVIDRPAVRGEFCGSGLFIDSVGCDSENGLKCMSSANEEATSNNVGICHQVEEPIPTGPGECVDTTPKCLCTPNRCSDRGWSSSLGMCLLGATTSDDEVSHCYQSEELKRRMESYKYRTGFRVPELLCSTETDRCDCNSFSCPGWVWSGSKCVLQTSKAAPGNFEEASLRSFQKDKEEKTCEDLREYTATQAVERLQQLGVKLIGWDFDGTIVSLFTPTGTYEDVAYVSERLNPDFLLMARALHASGIHQSITSFNNEGTVFIDGMVTNYSL